MKIRFLALLSVLTCAVAFGQPGPRNAPKLPEGTKSLRNVAYVTNGHERHKLDLFIPAGTTNALPLIIWVHGGAWMGGSKEQCPALPYLQKGYAVASINYRLSQHAIFPAQIEDCKAAVRWLRAHAKENNLDPDRFAVWGASAGGHLVALLGTAGDVKKFDVGPNLEVSSRVQAVVDCFGSFSYDNMMKEGFSASRESHLDRLCRCESFRVARCGCRKRGLRQHALASTAPRSDRAHDRHGWSLPEPERRSP